MKRKLLKSFFLATMFFATNGLLQAQDYIDKENCKDHPFFNRLEKFYLADCQENYDEYAFTIGQDKTQTLEGTVTKMIYSSTIPYGPELPSIFQVVKNYENAILKMGGKKVYSKTASDGGWTGATFHFQKDGNEYWLGIYDLLNNPVDEFTFVLLTKEGMKQEIEASAMFDKINSGSPLTLYINFETGKSSIKSESQNIIDELYRMLNENPSLSVIIEGHTDNVGNQTSNKSLSEQRALSIKNALVNKGISGDRMKTVGYGQDRPIADNSTDEGKAKNRRVEIKKQ